MFVAAWLTVGQAALGRRKIPWLGVLGVVDPATDAAFTACSLSPCWYKWPLPKSGLGQMVEGGRLFRNPHWVLCKTLLGRKEKKKTPKNPKQTINQMCEAQGRSVSFPSPVLSTLPSQAGGGNWMDAGIHRGS